MFKLISIGSKIVFAVPKCYYRRGVNLHEKCEAWLHSNWRFYILQFIFIVALISTWNGKVRANILEACETKCTRKSLQKEKANFIFYITLRDHYKFCKGRENRIMWLRKPKAFHSSACILEQSPFMYNDRFHRPDIIMSDIMREVLLISHCNHMFSQSLYQVYAFDYINVQYIF